MFSLGEPKLQTNCLYDDTTRTYLLSDPEYVLGKIQIPPPSFSVATFRHVDMCHTSSEQIQYFLGKVETFSK